MPVETVQLTGAAVLGVHAPTHYLTAQLPQTVKLGRIRPKAQPPALRLAAYFDPAKAAVPPPASINRRDKAAASMARMYLNDRYGCCVISGKAHALGLWSGNDSDSGGVVLATDDEIYQQYQGICGRGDNGCNIADVLDVMRSRGFTAGGKSYKIDGYVSVDHTNKLLVQLVQVIFGASTIGIDLPEAWTNNAVWDVTNSQIVGGHDVTPIDYDEKGVYVSSWGRVYLITWAAFTSQRWITEYYALLAPLWYGNDKLAPNGIDAAMLAADLTKLGGGVIPDPFPPAPPLPPTPPVPPAPPVPVPSWIVRFLEWLISLFGGGRAAFPTHPCHVPGAAFSLHADATLYGIDWQGIIAWVDALLKQYGPVIVPQLNAWIDALPVGPVVKFALHMLVKLLAAKFLSSQAA